MATTPRSLHLCGGDLKVLCGQFSQSDTWSTSNLSVFFRTRKSCPECEKALNAARFLADIDDIARKIRMLGDPAKWLGSHVAIISGHRDIGVVGCNSNLTAENLREIEQENPGASFKITSKRTCVVCAPGRRGA